VKAGIYYFSATDNALTGLLALRKALEELDHPCEVRAGELGR